MLMAVLAVLAVMPLDGGTVEAAENLLKAVEAAENLLKAVVTKSLGGHVTRETGRDGRQGETVGLCERRETGSDERRWERRWERRGETVEVTGRDGVAREGGRDGERLWK
jgi:hypothetical protein